MSSRTLFGKDISARCHITKAFQEVNKGCYYPGNKILWLNRISLCEIRLGGLLISPRCYNSANLLKICATVAEIFSCPITFCSKR